MRQHRLQIALDVLSYLDPAWLPAGGVPAPALRTLFNRVLIARYQLPALPTGALTVHEQEIVLFWFELRRMAWLLGGTRLGRGLPHLLPLILPLADCWQRRLNLMFPPGLLSGQPRIPKRDRQPDRVLVYRVWNHAKNLPSAVSAACH